MIVIIHMLVGALIGEKFNSIALIIILALATHFILDFIPHWDGKYNKEKFLKQKKLEIKKKILVVHMLLFLIGIFVLFEMPKPNGKYHLLLGVFFSLFPDMLNIFYLKSKNRFVHKCVNFHQRVQRNCGFLLGFSLQLIVFLILIKILF